MSQHKVPISPGPSNTILLSGLSEGDNLKSAIALGSPTFRKFYGGHQSALISKFGPASVKPGMVVPATPIEKTFRS